LLTLKAWGVGHPSSPVKNIGLAHYHVAGSSEYNRVGCRCFRAAIAAGVPGAEKMTSTLELAKSAAAKIA
jgi:hypothetical protein